MDVTGWISQAVARVIEGPAIAAELSAVEAFSKSKRSQPRTVTQRWR